MTLLLKVHRYHGDGSDRGACMERWMDVFLYPLASILIQPVQPDFPDYLSEEAQIHLFEKSWQAIKPHAIHPHCHLKIKGKQSSSPLNLKHLMQP